MDASNASHASEHITEEEEKLETCMVIATSIFQYMANTDTDFKKCVEDKKIDTRYYEASLDTVNDCKVIQFLLNKEILTIFYFLNIKDECETDICKEYCTTVIKCLKDYLCNNILKATFILLSFIYFLYWEWFTFYIAFIVIII